MAEPTIADIFTQLAEAARPDAAQAIYQRNQQYALPAPIMSGYQTKLGPLTELAFQNWVSTNHVPFDPSPTADYDMRGFYKALRDGSPHARTGINENDGMLHFSDYFKTPYHRSFSAESRFAKPGAAPVWNEVDQLEAPSGRIVFDERKQK